MTTKAANDNDIAPGRFCASCGLFFHLTSAQVTRNTMTCGASRCRTSYAQYRRRQRYLQRLQRRQSQVDPQAQVNPKAEQHQKEGKGDQ